MDKKEDILLKHYRRFKNEGMDSKKECPGEDLLWNYVREELHEKEREQIDGHLLTCSECLESLEVIRMIIQAEKSPQEVPAHLHQKAREILQQELKEPGLRSHNKPVVLTLTLLWDQLRQKIAQLKPDLGNLAIVPGPQVQPVRKAQQELPVKDLSSFPLRRTGKTDKGTIFLEIDRSGKEEFLTLKIFFQFKAGQASKGRSLRAVIYKSDRMCSSVYLDRRGEAVFNRIKDGEYYLELLKGDESLGMVELSISKVKK